MATSALSFKVTRQDPELIVPASPTPHEFRPLSDLDDQEPLRIHVELIQFYRRNPFNESKDPIKVFCDAIAKALVLYYPFAGRLRECGPRKLVVECNAEGVVFTAAHADATLQQFGDVIRPPFPNVDELIYDVPGSRGIVDSPLFLFQVTLLKCGGFIFGFRFIHTMCDAVGLYLFLSAIGDMARGADAPSIPPVWDRHLLSARCPPQVTFDHREYVRTPYTYTAADINIIRRNLVERFFFFDAADISALRQTLPPQSRGCSKFELVMSCIWRCRTFSLYPNPNEEVQFSAVLSIRSRLKDLLPIGYYGNVLVFPAAVAPAGKLIGNSLGYAVELVRRAKSSATEEYVRSVMDLMAVDRPNVALARSYMAADFTRVGLEEMDYGWGEAAYGGTTTVGIPPAPGLVSLATRFRNEKGEAGIAVPVCLPATAMEVFAEELEKMMMAARKGVVFPASAL